MKRFVIGLAAVTAVGAGLGAWAAGQPAKAALKGHELASQAKVSLIEARAIALKARPGRVTDQELEKEAGGSGLRYSFDIKSAGKTFEVGVDARTRAVLENKAEGANPD